MSEDRYEGNLIHMKLEEVLRLMDESESKGFFKVSDAGGDVVKIEDSAGVVWMNGKRFHEVMKEAWTDLVNKGETTVEVKGIINQIHTIPIQREEFAIVDFLEPAEGTATIQDHIDMLTQLRDQNWSQQFGGLAIMGKEGYRKFKLWPIENIHLPAARRQLKRRGKKRQRNKLKEFVWLTNN